MVNDIFHVFAIYVVVYVTSIISIILW